MSTENRADGIAFRPPRVEDGAEMWHVVNETGVLDPNSGYLYLLLARDFAHTCVVAEENGRLLGFVTGYRRPAAEDTVFLWQVGLRPEAQGRGLGRRLVHAFLASPGARQAAFLETTVTPSNEASRALFRAVARDFDAECRVGPCFLAGQFPQAGHEDEELFRIGPLPPRASG